LLILLGGILGIDESEYAEDAGDKVYHMIFE